MGYCTFPKQYGVLNLILPLHPITFKNLIHNNDEREFFYCLSPSGLYSLFFLIKEEYVHYLNNQKFAVLKGFGRVLSLACPSRHLWFFLLYSNSQFQHLYDFISTGVGQMKIKNFDSLHLALKFPPKTMRWMNMS